VKENDPESSVQVDGMTLESWSATVGEFWDANLYQTWAYGAARWGSRQLSHLTLRREGKIVAAAQVRIMRLPFVRAGLAYLRWGPLCVPRGRDLEEAVVSRMARELRREYVDRRGLALEVIPNAFRGTRRAEIVANAFSAASFKFDPAEAPSYRTTLLDLAPGLDDIRKRLDQKWRNQLNGANKNGLRLREGTDADLFPVFLELYQSMWDRKRFESSVDPRDFAAMQTLLAPDQRMRVLLAEKDGKAVAGLVASVLGDTGIYLLGASIDAGRELKASYWLQWQMVSQLKNGRAAWYDLGGIDPAANPGVHHFKMGLGGGDCGQLAPFRASPRGLSALALALADRARRPRRYPGGAPRLAPAAQ
jgi:lipid II:glycine glycyltransferase (peptidoglycan interpeptide bridge formation enzyme)